MCLRPRTAGGVLCLLQLHARRDTPLWLLSPAYGPRTALATARMAEDQNGRPPAAAPAPAVRARGRGLRGRRPCLCRCVLGARRHHRGLRVVERATCDRCVRQCCSVLWGGRLGVDVDRAAVGGHERRQRQGAPATLSVLECVHRHRMNTIARYLTAQLALFGRHDGRQSGVQMTTRQIEPGLARPTAVRAKDPPTTSHGVE